MRHIPKHHSQISARVREEYARFRRELADLKRKEEGIIALMRKEKQKAKLAHLKRSIHA